MVVLRRGRSHGRCVEFVYNTVCMWQIIIHIKHQKLYVGSIPKGHYMKDARRILRNSNSESIFDT